MSRGVVQQCSSCQAEIVWIKTLKGRAAPCDAKPVSILTLDGAVVRGYVSHFATCPNGAAHRKRREGAEAEGECSA